MPTMESLERFKVWVGEYSVGTDLATVAAHTLRSNHGPLPVGAVVFGGHLEITDAGVSAGGGKIQLQVQTAADLFAAALPAALTTGFKDLIPDMSGSTAIKLTAARAPAMEITIAVFTAGTFTVRLFYQ